MKYFFFALLALVIATAVVSNAKGEPTGHVATVTLTPTNHTAIRGAVEDESIDKALNDITHSNPNEVFYIYLESPGGSVFAGRRLVTYLMSTDRNIVCIANTAISMGFVILQACPVRLVTTQGILMTHQIASQAKGSLKELKSSVLLTEKLANLYDSLMAARMGLTLEAYRAKIDPEFWMIGVGEVLFNKAADGEVKVKCSFALEKLTEKLGEVTISKCPIT